MCKYDKNDPRVRELATRIKVIIREEQWSELDRVFENIRDLYYSKVDVSGRKEGINETAYHSSICAALPKLLPSPVRFKYQCDYKGFFEPIEANDVAALLKYDSYSFIHVIKTNAQQTARLYIPSTLKDVATCVARLWGMQGLTGLKIAGYEEAIDRADDVVAWFTTVDLAKTAGSIIDRSITFEGDRPVGSFQCSPGGRCGWANEHGSSVGTDVSIDLFALYGEEKQKYDRWKREIGKQYGKYKEAPF